MMDLAVSDKAGTQTWKPRREQKHMLVRPPLVHIQSLVSMLGLCMCCMPASRKWSECRRPTVFVLGAYAVWLHADNEVNADTNHKTHLDTRSSSSGASDRLGVFLAPLRTSSHCETVVTHNKS